MTKYAIYGELADVENGLVINDGVVLTDKDRIVYAGERQAAPNAREYEEIHATGMVLPGFIDCHAHLVGFPHKYMSEPDAILALKAAKDLQDLLNAGFTAARDMSRISPYSTPFATTDLLPNR